MAKDTRKARVIRAAHGAKIERMAFLDAFSDHIDAMEPGEVIMIRRVAGGYQVATFDSRGFVTSERSTIEAAYKEEGP